jgi:protein phosphatase 2C family protein 2/3
VYQLSKDHKPEYERERIEKNGGNIFKYNIFLYRATFEGDAGPYRIFPGKLSVSRSIGDVRAKLPILGGMSNVLIPKPEITSYKLTSKSDFIILGCDGIFDVLSNTEVIHSIWAATKISSQNIHEQAGKCTEMVIRNCLGRSASDNLTSVIIVFDHFKRTSFDNSNNIDICRIIAENLTSLSDNKIKVIDESYKFMLPSISKFNFLTPHKVNGDKYKLKKRGMYSLGYSSVNLPKIN